MLDNNTILFSEVMYNFLENAIARFITPKQAVGRIGDRIVPQTSEESFTGDGATQSFQLQNPPADTNDVIFESYINGEKVNSTYIDGYINFDIAPPMDSKIDTIWYYMGTFNSTLPEREEYILAQFIVACWSDFITNDKLDIIRLLGDTDFKLTSNATTTQSKVSWNISTMEKVKKEMARYSWETTITNRGY